MIEERLRLAAAALAFTGAAIAAYLSYTRLSSVSIMCPTSGCETVQRSTYSTLGGVPVAYIGLVAYLLIGAVAFSRRRTALHVSAALVTTGVVFSGYLLVVQVTVIDAVCTWCASSDAVMLALAVVTTLRGRLSATSARR